MNYRGLIWAGMYVEDLDASVVFYRDVLGLPFLGQGEDWAHFDSGAGSMLELFSGGKAQRSAKEPAQQSIVLGLRVDDLDRAMETLAGRGVQFIPGGRGESGGERWAHFYDPEGNRLELKQLP
ncbi:MAG TPA: VOC family protein [Anaerolineales bacterium]|nr:VOC family protein [Anaerolineales bacterium]